VPDNQLSLAIGKEGQNVRLAAKLTGLRIDIKSASEAEAEAKSLVTAEEPATVEEGLPVETPEAALPAIEEPTLAPVAADEAAKTGEEAELPSPITFEPRPTEEKVDLKFAEDISMPTPVKPGAKPKKKKKKGTTRKEKAEDGIKIKKLRRVSQAVADYEEDEEF
jgi:hypothetical protein